MKKITPEQAEISSAALQQFLEILEENRLATHDILMAKGDSLFFEQYVPPFHEDFLHRMYSVSKSFVSLAIGFLEQEGKLSLDDPIARYFPDETAHITDEHFKRQTIRHMLMMATANPDRYWFTDKPADRVRYYFENPCTCSRPSGTLFQYDSSGSFVLGALVERLSGMDFMDYLRDRLFSKIGVSEEAYCLKCPGGHSWGDSAILCTPRDLLLVARFVMNTGRWQGQPILNEAYVKAAVSRQIDNEELGRASYEACGYGYQFWMTYDHSYFFNGMGCQLAVCVPDKDLIFVYNGDNQGLSTAKSVIMENFFRLIARPMGESALPENPEAHNALLSYAGGMKLVCAEGAPDSPYAGQVNGVTYGFASQNPMHISKLSLHFAGDEGELHYTNASGDKVLCFGMGKNVIGRFPQEGYADKVGTVYAPGHFYRCAASAGWSEPHKLMIKVQIIDTYFGNALFVFSFREDGSMALSMESCAEDFLKEYKGFASGRRQPVGLQAE